MFVKRAYGEMIEKYFADAIFFKPTGDGLLVIFQFTEENLKAVSRKVISNSRKLENNFHKICKNDPVVNFDTPPNIGIGISRGSACCLESNNKTLDYSGRILNLASRLMELARPKGIVFDSKFGLEILSPAQKKWFTKDKVYIRGIADQKPIDIFHTSDIIVPASSKNPPEEKGWEVKKDVKTVKQIKDLGGGFIFDLKSKPTDKDDISVEITHPTMRSGKVAPGGYSTFHAFKEFRYLEKAGKPKVRLDFEKLSQLLTRRKVPNSSNITIEIMYPSKLS